MTAERTHLDVDVSIPVIAMTSARTYLDVDVRIPVKAMTSARIYLDVDVSIADGFVLDPEQQRLFDEIRFRSEVFVLSFLLLLRSALIRRGDGEAAVGCGGSGWDGGRNRSRRGWGDEGSMRA